MPTGRMNREQFYSQLAALDEQRLKKALWNLYWRGSAPTRPAGHQGTLALTHWHRVHPPSRPATQRKPVAASVPTATATMGWWEALWLPHLRDCRSFPVSVTTQKVQPLRFGLTPGLCARTTAIAAPLGVLNTWRASTPLVISSFPVAG